MQRHQPERQPHVAGSTDTAWTWNHTQQCPGALRSTSVVPSTHSVPAFAVWLFLLCGVGD